ASLSFPTRRSSDLAKRAGVQGGAPLAHPCSMNESFDIAGPAGRLEAILMAPDGPPVAAGVVCHADPLRGGVMHFKVVFRAAKAVQQTEVAGLRLTFRG